MFCIKIRVLVKTNSNVLLFANKIKEIDIKLLFWKTDLWKKCHKHFSTYLKNIVLLCTLI